MKYKLIADASCDLPKELAEKYDILFATGTINPGIQDAAFISMGDIKK